MTPSARPMQVPRGWRPLLAFAAAYALGMCIYLPFRAQTGTDFRDFWENAHAFLQTGVIRDDQGVHNYLPFFTLFMAPLGWLPLPLALNLFTLFSLTLAGLTAVMGEVLLRGRLTERPRAALLAALGLILPYLHASTTLGAVNVLLLFLIMAMWLLLDRGRDWLAGIPLALAVLLKLLPGALLLFLLLIGRWRSAAAAVLVMIVLGLGLPLARLGWSETRHQHEAFYERAVVGGSARATITAEQPQKAKYTNVALPIVLRRLLTPTNAYPQDNEPGFFVNFADLPLDAVWVVYCALAVLLLIVTSWATLLGAGPRPPPGEPLPPVLHARFGAWTALMVLLSPLVWTHYLILLYWPLALACDRLQTIWNRQRRICRAAGLAVGGWSLGIIALAWPAARAVGVPYAAVLCVWLAMILLSRTLSPAASPRESAPPARE